MDLFEGAGAEGDWVKEYTSGYTSEEEPVYISEKEPS